MPGQTRPTRRWHGIAAAALVLLAVLVTAPLAEPVGAATTPPGFHPLTPARLLDTRPGGRTVDAAGVPGSALGPAATYDLVVAGRGGVPTTGVSAVALNVTATEPTQAGYLTAWATGAERPLASSLNFVRGQTVPNLVIVGVGTGGAVSLFNSAGSTQLVVDVAGWFAAGSTFSSVTPARLLDTRPGATTIDGRMRPAIPLGPDGLINVPVTGRGGVPADATGSVVLNLTATGPTADGYLTAFPTGEDRPLASSLNVAPGQTVANLVVVRLGTGGQVTLYNARGATDVVVDVAGWFPAGGSFNGVSPARLADTRPGATTIDGLGAGIGALVPNGTIELAVAGRAGVPASGATAVVLNVTATGPTAAGYVTVWPAGTPLPLASSLNLVPGRTVANLVVAKLGTDGRIALYNATGSTHLVVDVAGWFGDIGGSTGGPDPTPPTTAPPGTAPGATAPGAPRDVSASVTGTSVVLSFRPPASDGGLPVTGYAASCTPAAGGPAVQGSAVGSPITLAGLTSGVTYRCGVAASNPVATSVDAFAPNVTITGKPTRPAPPTGVTVEVLKRSVRVSFTPSASDGGRPITQYAATCSRSAGGDKGRRTGRGSGSPVTVTKLQGRTEYFCRVVAINSVGESALSERSAVFTTGR